MFPLRPAVQKSCTPLSTDLLYFVTQCSMSTTILPCQDLFLHMRSLRSIKRSEIDKSCFPSFSSTTIGEKPFNRLLFPWGQHSRKRGESTRSVQEIESSLSRSLSVRNGSKFQACQMVLLTTKIINLMAIL